MKIKILNNIPELPDTRKNDRLIRELDELDRRVFPDSPWGADSFRDNLEHSYDFIIAAFEDDKPDCCEESTGLAVTYNLRQSVEIKAADRAAESAGVTESAGTSETGEDTDSGRITGYAILRVAGDAELLLIGVDPEDRKHGTGRKLMEQVICEARKQGADSVFLEVRASNHPAISLYRDSGFRDVSLRKNYYHNPAEDALILKYSFSETGRNNNA